MIVSLDTSTLTLSLALLAPDGGLVEQRLEGPPKRQSVVLPDCLSELLARHGKTLRDVTGLVCGLGPGSFTGLRIGLATLKGLSYALQVPLVGVSSLQALALDVPAPALVLAVAVVKKGELYLGKFRRTADAVEPLGAVTSATVAACGAWLGSDEGRGFVVVGPALTDYAAALEAHGVDPARLLPEPRVPSAAALARLARWPTTYEQTHAFALEPDYVRGSGAEENPKFPPLPGVPAQARLKEDP